MDITVHNCFKSIFIILNQMYPFLVLYKQTIKNNRRLLTYFSSNYDKQGIFVISNEAVVAKQIS